MKRVQGFVSFLDLSHFYTPFFCSLFSSWVLQCCVILPSFEMPVSFSNLFYLKKKKSHGSILGLFITLDDEKYIFL